MAKIKGEQIIEKDALGDFRKSAKSAEAEVVILSKSLTDLVDIAKDVQKNLSLATPKDLKQLTEKNKLIKESNAILNSKKVLDIELKKATVEYNNAIKKNNANIANNIKLRKANEDIKKKQLQTEREIIKNEELRVKQEKRIQKDREIEIKKRLALEKKELDAYQKKSKRLNELRKRYKALLAEEGKATRETRKLGKEVNRLDKELKDIDGSAGQFQRKVGEYPKTMGDAAKGLLDVAAAAITAKGAIDGVSSSLNSSTEGSESVREATAAVSGFFDVAKDATASLALDVWDNLVAGFNRLRGAATLKDFDVGYKRTAKATEDLGDKITDTVDGQIALTRSIIEFEKAVRPLEVKIAELNGQIEKQGVIAGDSTRSFSELENAVLKGQQLQQEKAKINIDIAQRELDIIQEKIRLDEISGVTNIDLLDQETQALIKVKEAKTDLAVADLESEKELNQIKQDRLERDLDILIDGFDNQKTINERIIANDKENLQKRADLLEDTKRLADESFKGQKDVLADLSGAGIDVDELLKLDATELQKQIRLLEQSEIIEGRTLEVVRERKMVLQDLQESSEDLQDSQNEALESKKDILAQEKALADLKSGTNGDSEKTLADLEAKRLENEIQLLRDKLENVKEGSLEELQLKQELNDALISQQEQALEKEKEAEEKAQKRREERAKNREKKAQEEADRLAEIREKAHQFTDDVISSYTDKFISDTDKRIAKIDEEINKYKEQANAYQQQAENGTITAEKSLAEQEALIAESEVKKAKLEQKKQIIELASSFILGYNSALEGGATPTEALLQAGTGTAGVKAFISALPTFFDGDDGTDNTGQHGRGIDGRGGFLSIKHPNEMILTSDQTNELKGMGIYSRADLFDNLESKMFNENIASSGLNTNVIIGNDNSVLEMKMDEMTKAVKSIPQNNIELAQITSGYMMINQTKTRGNRTTTNRFKVN